MSRLAQPQLSFADLELQNQGVHLDPVWAKNSILLKTRVFSRPV